MAPSPAIIVDNQKNKKIGMGMNYLRTALILALTLFLEISRLSTVLAQVIETPFNSIYTLTDLGAVPGLPTQYGGLTFLAGDPNTILIGGNANQAAGKLYSIGVIRDGDNHITGFSGTASIFADAAYNDGGVAYGPGNVLFLARWPGNEMGQTKPGSAITDKIINLTLLGVEASPGGLNFVPAGFPGAGQLKSVSYSGGEWYTLDIAADGTGTFDITGVTFETSISGGPEGFVYVPPGSALFSDLGLELLVSEYAANNVAAYDIDGDGDPIPNSRVPFITGLNGAEGAQIDPLTGDFLFSTFGANDRVLVVQGFNAPVPVELSSFTGRMLANKVILNWTTQTENNNLGFEIERSENEIDFQKIGFVEGKVTTTWPEQYIFEDQNLEPGSYIYRLKQIDLDGAFEYSDLLYITVSPPRAFSVLQNYPNPFNPETTIRYDLPVASRVVLKIYSILGKEVRTLVNAEQTAGFKSVVWDGRNEAGNHMSSGVYIYRISAGKSTETHKLLLVR